MPFLQFVYRKISQAPSGLHHLRPVQEQLDKDYEAPGVARKGVVQWWNTTKRLEETESFNPDKEGPEVMFRASEVKCQILLTDPLKHGQMCFESLSCGAFLSETLCVCVCV